MTPVGAGRPTLAAASRRSNIARLSTLPFLVGYALAWSGFSALAAFVHVGLLFLGTPVPFALEARFLSAAVLVLCGSFQFTTLKQACLTLCRSPAGFFLTHWRDGFRGHLMMGLQHGLHCTGCCWTLMVLALVAGMANLVWMALLMAIMVAETALPFGARLTKPVGVMLILAGALVLFV